MATNSEDFFSFRFSFVMISKCHQTRDKVKKIKKGILAIFRLYEILLSSSPETLTRKITSVFQTPGEQDESGLFTSI